MLTPRPPHRSRWLLALTKLLRHLPDSMVATPLFLSQPGENWAFLKVFPIIAPWCSRRESDFQSIFLEVASGSKGSFFQIWMPAIQLLLVPTFPASEAGKTLKVKSPIKSMYSYWKTHITGRIFGCRQASDLASLALSWSKSPCMVVRQECYTARRKGQSILSPPSKHTTQLNSSDTASGTAGTGVEPFFINW